MTTQHDYDIANGTGAAVRGDINSVLQAIVSNNSGTSEPSTTFKYQWWADETNNVLKIRNSANNAWITLRELDGTLLMEDGTAAAPGLSFASDTDTGIFRDGTNSIALAAQGSERFSCSHSSVIVNQDGDDVDFRVESSSKTHLLYVDGGTNLVGIDESAPASLLSIGGNATTTAKPTVSVVPSSGNASISLRGGSPTIAFDITSGGDGTIIYDSSSDLLFKNGTLDSSSEVARINEDGILLIGSSTKATAGTAQYAYLQIAGNTAGTSGSVLDLKRGESASQMSDGDSLGTIVFTGTTGGDFATILGSVDGSPSGSDFPGRIVFSTTADGGNTPTERLRIDSSGNIGIGNSSPSEIIDVIQSAQGDAATLRIRNSADSNASTNVEIVARQATRTGGRIVFGRENANSWNSAAGYASGFISFNPTDAGTDTEHARLTSAGQLFVGTTSELISGSEKKLQMTHANAGAEIVLGRNDTSVTAGNSLGAIKFVGNDSNGTYQQCAKIEAIADGTHQTDDKSTRLVFSNTEGGDSSPTERMRITNSGYSKFSPDGTYQSATGTWHEFSGTENSTQTLIVKNRGASFAHRIQDLNAVRSATSSYSFLRCYSGNYGDTEFTFRGDGNAYADSSWNGGGADYAEYFEWSDGNSAAEDRRGISVVLDGDKIREAVAGEEPIGVISGNPSVVGDADIDRWKGKYLRDDYGTYIEEDYEVEDEDGNTVVQQRRQLNPDYNPDTEYVSRENRAEWDTVGLMGKLRVRKGQVTGTRWIKMRDVSDTVEEWLVR